MFRLQLRFMIGGLGWRVSVLRTGSWIPGCELKFRVHSAVQSQIMGWIAWGKQSIVIFYPALIVHVRLAYQRYVLMAAIHSSMQGDVPLLVHVVTSLLPVVNSLKLCW